MFSKKFINYGLAVALMAPVAMGLAGCGEKDSGSKTKVNAKDVYAMSALSSATYLNQMDSAQRSGMLLADNSEETLTRPSGLAEEEIKLISEYVDMFDSLLLGGMNQTSGKPAEDDIYYGTYNIVLNISIPKPDGGTEVFNMYYNETKTETDKEVEDNGEEELEVSTKLEGVMLLGDQVFDVTGERNVETEGKETEVSIEFTTKSKTNADNYIKVKQEVENDEVEYEYSIYENKNLKSKTKIEFETENDEHTMQLQFKNPSSGTLNKTKYEIKRSATQNNEFVVKYSNDVIRDVFSITVTESGKEFTYSNGFSETI